MHPRPLVASFACLVLAAVLRAVPAPAPSAAAARPLAAGARVPAVMVETATGDRVDLATLVARQPTLLVFYRGSWCPYCNKHLAALAGIEPQLLELGYQILAVSPDGAAGLRQAADKNHLNYRLLSDATMAASAAFGLAFRVDEKTAQAYAGYGITLPTVPGEPSARWLPVPAAYLVGSDGVIRFAHADPDYKTRLTPEAVLAAARAARR